MLNEPGRSSGLEHFTFPSRRSVTVACRIFALQFPLQEFEEAPYSYGDSAGLSPDFPFNPGFGRQEPDAVQMCGNCFLRPNISIHGCVEIKNRPLITDGSNKMKLKKLLFPAFARNVVKCIMSFSNQRLQLFISLFCLYSFVNCSAFDH